MLRSGPARPVSVAAVLPHDRANRHACCAVRFWPNSVLLVRARAHRASTHAGWNTPQHATHVPQPSRRALHFHVRTRGGGVASELASKTRLFACVRHLLRRQEATSTFLYRVLSLHFRALMCNGMCQLRACS